MLDFDHQKVGEIIILNRHREKNVRHIYLSLNLYWKARCDVIFVGYEPRYKT